MPTTTVMVMVMMMTMALASTSCTGTCVPVAHEIQYVRFDREFYWIWLLCHKHTHTGARRPWFNIDSPFQRTISLARAPNTSYMLWHAAHTMRDWIPAITVVVGGRSRHMEQNWYRNGCILYCAAHWNIYCTHVPLGGYFFAFFTWILEFLILLFIWMFQVCMCVYEEQEKTLRMIWIF